MVLRLAIACHAQNVKNTQAGRESLLWELWVWQCYLCNGGYNSDANNTNGTDEHDDDTNGGYDKDSKEDSENIADNVHHNNGEQGHLKVFLTQWKWKSTMSVMRKVRVKVNNVF